MSFRFVGGVECAMVFQSVYFIRKQGGVKRGNIYIHKSKEPRGNALIKSAKENAMPVDVLSG
jgi:hypothetical protein